MQGDYVSGASRLMEAIVRSVALSFGVLVGLTGMCIIPAFQDALLSSTAPAAFGGTLKYVVYTVAALIFSAGFCVLFEVPPRLAAAGSVIGCLGKMCFIYLTGEGAGAVFSTLLAASLVAILAQICARVLKAPTIPFLISGIMALVPGSALYKSIFAIVVKEYSTGAVMLLDTILVAGAIAVAIFMIDTAFQIIGKAWKK